MTRELKGQTLTIRIADAVRGELERGAKAGPYPISLTAIVERGILLAVAELDEMNRHARLPVDQGLSE